MVVSPYISCSSKDFDISRIAKYGLTIQISLGGFSFVIQNPELNSLVALQAFNSIDITNDIFPAIKSFCADNNVDASAFGKITFVIDDANYAIVPSAFYEQKYAGTYLDFCNDNSGNEIVSETVEKAGCVVVYGINGEYAKNLRTLSDNVEFRHSASIIIGKLLSQNIGLSQYVNVRHSDFDVMVAEDNKILFYNSFKFSGVDEFVYYLVTVMRQYGSTDDVGLFFIGSLMPDSEVVKLSERYVRNIAFIDAHCRTEIDVPSHFFYVPLSIG